MSKGTEALKELRKQSKTHGWLEQQFEKGWLNAIEKELKALEIIKKKSIGVFNIQFSYSVEEYNMCKGETDVALTKEEFDLLKEVLK